MIDQVYPGSSRCNQFYPGVTRRIKVHPGAPNKGSSVPRRGGPVPGAPTPTPSLPISACEQVMDQVAALRGVVPGSVIHM